MKDLTQQTQPLPESQFPAQQNFDDYHLKADPSVNAYTQMLSMFGNPSLTNFDQADVFAGVFGGGSRNASINDEEGMGMGLGTECAQGMHGEFGQ
jgi:hypothetical protein